jgi:branched-chain amino acid transport system ATP-binding protein
MSLLEVDSIHTYYGASHVLHGVSLCVGEGEAVALLGRNGAGKTTVMRSIMGFTPAREGRIALAGEAIQSLPSHQIVRRGLAIVPQGRRIFAPLSVRENLLIGARGGGWDLARIYRIFPRLEERATQAGGTLSGGEAQMLAIGRALLTNGRLLLLDEPSEGLAPAVVREVGRVLRMLKAERLSILLVEQNYPLALHVADRVYVLNKGEIVWEGTPLALEAAEDVKRRYLGVA